MSVPCFGLVLEPFRPGVVEGAAAYARANGLGIDPRWSVRGERMVERPEWDGVIAATSEWFWKPGLPVVSLGYLGKDAPRVVPDYRACGAAAFPELVAAHPASLIVLRGSIQPPEEESCAGFLDAATTHGRRVIDPEPARKLAHTALTWHDRVGHFADLLQEVPRPAGIFIAVPELAWALVAELLARHFHVPGDFHLVTLDTGPPGLPLMAPVPLTTVDPDDWQQGYFAARMLHERILSPAGPVLDQRLPPAGVTRRESSFSPTGQDPVVSRILHLIRERFATDLKLGDLARTAGVGRRTLEERFKKETRLTLHEALTLHRIAEAKRLLHATPLSIPLVAEACGFSSVPYFTTAFRRATGSTPGAFRQAEHLAKQSVRETT